MSNRPLKENIRNLYETFALYEETSIFANMFNFCYGKLAIPELMSSTSAIFSIGSAIWIVLGRHVLHTLKSFFIPVAVCSVGFVVVVGPTLCGNVHSRTAELIDKQHKCLFMLRNISLAKKKHLALNRMKINIGDCYFDKQIPLTMLNYSLSNTITVLLSISIQTVHD